MFFSFSLMLKNLKIGGGALESTGNVTITNRECLNDYLKTRDELLTLKD